jgi:cyanate permease
MISSEKNKYRFVIAALVILVRTCVGLIWASAGPLLSLLMQQYSISRGTVSWYASVVSIIMVTFAVPAGIIGMRMGAKRLFAVGAFLQASCIIAPFCSSFALLLLTRVLFAIGIALNAPIAVSIFAEWFSSRQLPLVNGLTMAFVTLGNALAFVVTIPLANALSWQLALTVYGIISLVFALAWLVWGRDQQKVTVDAPVINEEPPINVINILKQRTSIVLALSLIGPFCLSTALSYWLPTYYHRVFGMPLETASSILAILTVTGAIAALIGGILPMRLGLRKPFLVIPGLLMGLVALGSFMFNNLTIILLSVALFGIVSSLQMASIFTIPMELPGVTPRMGAIVLALTLGAGNIGSFMGPLIIGYLSDFTGSYLPGFIICSALSLSLFAGGLLLPETGPRVRKTAAGKVVER